MTINGHAVKHWATTQTVVALSSAEAELIALVKGGTEVLGMRSLLRDLGERCGITMGVDAAATIGVVKRHGVGRVRHLDVRYLWIQEKIRSGDFHVWKVLGTENPADLMTKFLSSEQIHAALVSMNAWFMEGRAVSAPVVSLLIY